MIKEIRYLLEYLLLRLVIRTSQIFSWKNCHSIGELLGRIVFDLLGFRRKVTLINLRLAFPQMGEEELFSLGRRSYQNLGRTFFDLLKLSHSSPQRRIDFEGLDNLDRALKGRKGGIILSGHFGSWEFLMAALAQRGYPLDAVAKEQHNRLVDRLVNGYRMRSGMGVIKAKGGAWEVVGALRRNRLVGVLADQDAGRDGLVVSFFSQPSSFSSGPALIAEKTGSPLIVAFIVREGGKERIIITRPLPPGGRKERTQIYAQALEGFIKSYPDHWFWPHKRWKSTVGPY